MKRLLSVLILATMVLSLAACNNEPTVLTTVPTTAPFVPVPTGPVYERENYTAELESLKAQYSTVIAELGDCTIDLEVLQIAYWTEFVSFVYNNSGYLAMYNLDLALPLHEQSNPGTGGNWQQYFMAQALNSLQNHLAMIYAAQLEGITMPEEIQTTLDNEMEQMRKTAAEEGFEDMDAYVSYLTGPGCTLKGLQDYNYLTLCSSYYQEVCFSRFEITDELVEEFYEAHKEDFINAGMIQDDRFIYQVRHILVSVDTGADDATWEEARVKAQGLLDQYLAGEQTQDAFAQLAAEHSDDGETYRSGGMVNGLVPESTYPTEFKAWYLDEQRQPGDVSLIKTDLGYHVMYYIGTQATWRYEAQQSMVNTMISAIVPDTVAKYPMTVHYDKLLVAEAEQ